jgi:hypothetical protein
VSGYKQADLDAIEARLALATQGPWRVKEQDPKQVHRDPAQVEENGRGVEVIAECYCGAYDGRGLRNDDLIAHAPEDLAALIEEVCSLRVRTEKAEANYAFMVERAANEKLDGYRELGARAASAENEADCLRARLREVKVELTEARLTVLLDASAPPSTMLTEEYQARPAALSRALCGEPVRALWLSGSGLEGWCLSGQRDGDFALPDTKGCRTWLDALSAAEIWVQTKEGK